MFAPPTSVSYCLINAQLMNTVLKYCCIQILLFTVYYCFVLYINTEAIRLAAGHGEWSDYSLESTARVLANKFPEHAVWVVTPTAHLHGKLASYDNFARTDWASGGAVPHCECRKQPVEQLAVELGS